MAPPLECRRLEVARKLHLRPVMRITLLLAPTRAVEACAAVSQEIVHVRQSRSADNVNTTSLRERAEQSPHLFFDLSRIGNGLANLFAEQFPVTPS